MNTETAMLAMHYAIPLAGPDAVAAVRRRAADRGPLFDGLPGLAHKLFLVDAADPGYATFYLWPDADAALAFLEGPFFQALVAQFGRPDVRLLLTHATHLPFATGESLRLVEDAARIDHADVHATDPRTGHSMSLSRGAASGRCFDVAYHAVGAQA